MRDLSAFKFRCWNRLARKMAVIDALFWSTDGYLAHTADGSSGSGPLRHIVLMQWTGLVDKKGKEIYEGDIVTWQAMGQTYTRVVEWAASRAEFLPNNMQDETGEVGGTVEVIGNIYEHRALRVFAAFQADMARLVTNPGESQEQIALLSQGILQIAQDTSTTTDERESEGSDGRAATSKRADA